VIFESVSDPMTSSRSAPMASMPWATVRAYTKPEQAALTSNAPPTTPIPSWTVADVPGTIWSGVVVARMTASISSGRRPAFSRAASPASMASCEVVPPILRSRIPVRSRIQASLVSRVRERSSLVTTLSGTAMP
jgi:hypothetical protein